MNNSFFKILSDIKEYVFDSYESLAEDIKGYDYAVIYKLDKVVVCIASEVTKGLLDDFIELRAFNKSGELHVLNDGKKYLGRIRTDGTGNNTECIDESHLIWGEPEKRENNSTFLIEDRGTQLFVPIDVPDGERAFVTVRNYLCNDTSVFDFDDFRMVNLFSKKARSFDDDNQKGDADNE